MEYNYYNAYYPDYLMHYGVKGMKWGHRRAQAFSVKATGHRALAKVYDINAKTYKKSNKALSSMNATARTQQLKKAEQAQAAADAKKAARVNKSERGKASVNKALSKNTKVKDAVSFKAAGHKALAKVFEINEKTYKKSNKSLSSMNAAAKEDHLAKARQAQADANKRRYGR